MVNHSGLLRLIISEIPAASVESGTENNAVNSVVKLDADHWDIRVLCPK